MTTHDEQVPKHAEWEYCPTCGGELDTGFECNRCGRDWQAFTKITIEEIEAEQ